MIQKILYTSFDTSELDDNDFDDDDDDPLCNDYDDISITFDNESNKSLKGDD